MTDPVSALERVQPFCPLCGAALTAPAAEQNPAGTVQRVTCGCGATVKAVFSRPQRLETMDEGDELS